MHATRAYEPGEQIFINYGHHSNLRLLRNYGFTLAENAHDTLEIPLPEALTKLSSTDFMLQEKHELLRSLRLGDGLVDGMAAKKMLRFASDGQLAAQSHQWLQILLASREELQSLFQQATAPTQSDAASLRLPESLRTKIQHQVRELCQERLKTHKTPLEVRFLGVMSGVGMWFVVFDLTSCRPWTDRRIVPARERCADGAVAAVVLAHPHG